uniref:Eukaryotic translation initiation factor 3 subunit G n=1 Tax=Xenopus tropicalis TaxID=8364 RepID=F6VGS1_XENTR
MSCPEDCNEQGRCVSGVCVCDSGFIGPDCGTRVCSPECERRGRCEDGECICNPGFTGPDCEIKTCPNDCHKQGMCVDGKCVCDSGYTGVDCQVKTCPNKCHNRGRCEDGICICNSGYSGSDCGSKSCPKNCSGNGQCVKGKCVCDSGFIGPVCGTRACPAGCGNHGRCLRGTCVCSPGYTGVDCASRLCPKNCHNRGRCEQGVCICNPEYIGLDCGSRTCPKNCHGKGQCDDGVCICDLGYTGLDCATKSCFNDCHHRGRCEDGVCICDVGYTGLDCGTLSCPKDCHNRGKCENGVCCICDSGYTDHDCGSKMCSNNCQNHGICDNGKCICDSGYAGVDCGLRTCQNDCNNRGQCIDGVCICNSGYTDLDCGFRTCPFECHNRGQCVNGICICDSGYSGLDCGSASCPNNCQNRGKCHNGECVCDFGYTGVECGTEACPENCHIHGRCEQGVCICQPGYTGLDCRSKSCPKNCSGNGQCINGKCICDFGYTGPVCGSRACPGNCGGRGKCINGVCVCKKGYEGADCSVVVTELVAVTGLHVTSVEESSVTIEWDLQQTPPDVYAISFKAKVCNYKIRLVRISAGNLYINPVCILYSLGIEAPLGLRVTEITTTSFLLRWERPQSFPDRYIVTLVSPTGKERKLKVPGKGDRVRITALEEGTIYKVILRAERGQEQSKGMETTAKTGNMRRRERGVKEESEERKGSLHIKAVIENLPTKLSVYNGTFIQRLESYLRSTSYPLRANQTVESVARAIFLYLTIQALGSAGPSTHPTSVKISGPGIFGRPTVVKSTPTNLVVSLDGLGVLLDKVMIHYRPFQAIMTDMPQQLEVGKGVGKVVIRDLEPGTTYRLEIHGLLRGQSSKSYILVADTGINYITNYSCLEMGSSTTRPRIPVQMGALQVRNVTSESITLVWKAKIGAYDSFLVRYDEVTDGVSPQELSVPGDQREVTLRGLTQDTRYEVLLYGIREGKLTRVINVIQIIFPFFPTEPHPKRGTPPRLSPLLVSEVHRNSALLSWEPLDGDFDAYILRYGSPEGPMQEETLRGDQTSFLISGLVAAVNYSVELRGIWGESYTEPQATYRCTPPGPQKPQPPRLESLTLFDVRSESLNLSWDVQGGDFDSFLLWYRDGEGKPQEIALDKDLRSSTVRDLKPGKKYKFVLYGISGEKRSKPVTAEGSTDKLQPPQLESLSVSDVHSDSVLLSWVVQGGKFDSFLLNYRDAEGKPKEASLEGEQRSVPVGDLKPGKKYKFVLYGISGGKKSKAAIAETTTSKNQSTVLVLQIKRNSLGKLKKLNMARSELLYLIACLTLLNICNSL